MKQRLVHIAQIQVSELMRHDALRIPADASISEAIELIVNAAPDWYPVVDDSGVYYGVVTLHDLLRCCFPMLEGDQYPDLRTIFADKVIDIISREYPPVSAQDNLHDVLEIMMKRNYSSLPVLNGGLYLGMIRLHEIARLLSCSIE